jgi:hypothetical protein
MPTMIPAFLLKKLYVKDSFKNTPNGFELALRNTLAPGTLIGFGQLQIDGRDVPLDKLFISVGDGAWLPASELAPNKPQVFPLNTRVGLRVQDQPLVPGKHRLVVQVSTKEAGELKIDAEDTIQ